MPTPHRRAIAALATTLVLTGAALAAPPDVAAATDPVPIATIQGTTDASPLVGQTVTTTPSIVTAVYGVGSGELNGFVIQTPGTGGPHRDLSKASDAVFVYAPGGFDVRIGQAVAVSGKVVEFNGLTEIGGAVVVTPLQGGFRAPKPVTEPWSRTADQRENLESMLYSTRSSFTVANTFTLQYGELGLADGRRGELPGQPTDAAPPGTARNTEQSSRNAAISVGLDDGTNRGFFVSSTLAARRVPYLTAKKTVRVGDQAKIDQPVIVDFRNSRWTFEPTTPFTAGHEIARITATHRPKAPRVGGSFSVASFNVLNYFTTLGQGRTGCRGGNLSTDGTYNVTDDCDARGAWDAADLARQQTKIVTAINKLDADVTGLMEIENSIKLGEPTDEALSTLVAALNRASGHRKWAYVRSSTELQSVADQDVITNAMIYQPAHVSLLGKAYALGAEADSDGAFANARTPIAATFRDRSGGKPMLVVVNHFKSKGSAPATTSADADQGDGQGAWNATRVRAAKALLGWLPGVQRSAHTSAVTMVGDYNSYSAEDPLRVLADGGFTNAAPEREYSYSFDGLAGSLDHVLVNRAARQRMTGSRVWNINSVAAPLTEYSQYRSTSVDLYRPDQYRSSDHDPVVAGFRRR